jgi:ABC-type molybdate transport system permease subunit
VSERLACRVLGQHRSTQRKVPKGRADDAALTADIVELATRYGRYGYRRIAALLTNAGWTVNVKRVERIWRQEGLKVPARQPKKGRLWLNDGSCIRLRPEYPNHVWSYDFVEDRTHMAPLSLPGLILGLALLQFFTLRDLPRDISALMIGHVIITMPFAIRFVTVSLTGINANVELAARSLGADGWTTFRTVTFPLARGGIIASLLFTFILSFDDVAVSLFLSNANATTLPVRIYTYIDQNYDPLVTAVSALVVFLAFIVLAIVERIMGVGRLFGIH